MNTKLITAAALAALAVPTVAQAKKPDDAGDKGRTTAAAKKAGKASKGKGVGFVVAGTLVDPAGVDVAAKSVALPLSLDLTSANRHARAVLGSDVTREFVAGDGQKAVGAEGDAFRVRFVGFDAGEPAAAGDRVKVAGKVTRVKKGGTAPRVVDVRKVTVFDADPAPEQPDGQ